MSRDIVDTSSTGRFHGSGSLCGGRGGRRGPLDSGSGPEPRGLQELGGSPSRPLPGWWLRGIDAQIETPPYGAPADKRRAGGRDRPASQTPGGGGLRRRAPHHPLASLQATRRRALGLDHLAGSRPPGVRGPPAPKAATEFVHPLRGSAAQRMLAGRHHALEVGRRQRSRHLGLHRRPLPPDRGRHCSAHDQGPRCDGHLPRCSVYLGLSRFGAHGQWCRLQRPLPPRGHRARDRTEGAGHHLQAFSALPSPDLRQDRALAPDPQTIPGQATTGPNGCRPASTG